MNKSYKNSGYNTGRNNYYESKPKKYTNKLDSLFEKSLSASNTKKEEETKEQINSKQNYNEKKYENEKDYYQQYDNNNENAYQDDYSNYNSSYNTGRNKDRNYNYNSNYDYNYQNKYDKKQNYQQENYANENYENPPSEEKVDQYFNDNSSKYDSYYYKDNNNNEENQSSNLNINKNYNASNTRNKRAKKNINKPKISSQEEKIKIQKDQIEKIVSKLTYKAPELTYNLINELIEADYECMICNDVVNQSEETWGCDKCHTIYHIKCIYDWIFKLNTQKQDDSLNKNKKVTSIFKWSCPHCNCNYSATTDNLPKYNCYCKRFYKAQEGSKKGVAEYKDFDPELIPHGCGLLCNTKICRHVICNLPCHPGPHLACNEIEELIC